MPRVWLLQSGEDGMSSVLVYITAPTEEHAMKAMLYLPDKSEPVAVLDEVTIVEFTDNHQRSPLRIFYAATKLNSTRTMIKMERESKMTLTLEDGRSLHVLLQHSSLDMQGGAVGVLRVLGDVRS
jgi:hypothetical protein